MDSDTLKRKEDYRRILGDFRMGKIDILVGTQMIAKGLHFPNVTLVGIISADLALHLPDFRASERTFQLLTQVAGRAGRGDIEGEVVVQSFTPFHPAIQYARRHDFGGFYEQEIGFREQLKYPPVTRVALLTLKGRNEDKVKLSAEHLKRELEKALAGVKDLVIGGPGGSAAGAGGIELPASNHAAGAADDGGEPAAGGVDGIAGIAGRGDAVGGHRPNGPGMNRDAPVMVCQSRGGQSNMRSMKAFLMFVLLCFLTATPELRAQSRTADDDYFDVYSLIVKADRLADKGKMEAAQTNYITARKELKQLQQDYPLWNPKVVKYRLGYLDNKISAAATAKPMAPSRHATGDSASQDKAADNGQAVALKMKWQVGKRYEQQVKAAINMMQTMPGQNQPMKSELGLTQGLAMSVLKETDGGGRQIELELLDTLLDVKSGGMTVVSFDSKQPPTADAAANPAAAMLKNVNGAKLKFETDANGPSAIH